MEIGTDELRSLNWNSVEKFGNKWKSGKSKEIRKSNSRNWKSRNPEIGNPKPMEIRQPMG
jgi:hypothetical protein